MLLKRAAETIEPRPRSRSLDWCREHVFTHEGKPYDHSAYPHLGAPGGPMDAFDFAGYRSISLQWASRLGKSFVGQSLTMKQAACQPCPLMFASADQKLAVEVTDRTYRMLDYCPPLRGQLRPPHRRKQDLIDLASCRMFVGWARSTSTLADKAVRVGHANEIDKWEHQSTSKEADPLKLFSDRFKEFPSHKKIYESTPALKQSSRIERLRLASCNAAFWVPCPHCKRYQTLKMAQLTWEKNEAGKSTKDQARRTAKYTCEHCQAEIRDEHRGPMMRAGVWVPEGCGVDDAKAAAAAKAWAEPGRQPWKGWSLSDWITGAPLRDGQDYGSQLSSLFALSLSWGDIAAEWVDVQRNPQNLRNFVNQWLAETWEVRGSKATWQDLARRMIITVAQFTVPLDCSILTCGADIQADHCVYVVDAWGEGRRSHTVDYGTLDTIHELYDVVLKRSFPHEDGGEPLRIALTLVDSGFHPKDVYQFCQYCAKNRVQVWPCKGSSNALGSPYNESRLGKDTLLPGAPIMHIDTLTTQDWLQHQLSLDIKASEGAATLFRGSQDTHQDFLEQLLNEACIQKLKTDNNTREVWERIDATMPNDYRDCRRYAFAAMLRVTRGAPIRPRVRKVNVAREPVEKPRGVQFLERPGGWVQPR